MNHTSAGLSLALPILLCGGQVMGTPLEQPYAPGIESPGYVWNAPNEEQMIALALQGDPVTGEEAYEICRGCHQADASGRGDAIYPQLAGQHASVLIKQMVDVRAGRRDNPKMHPFVAEGAVSTEEVADIAAYLSRLPIPDGNLKGDGTALARGQALYQQDCAGCHGEQGQGNADEFYPRVAHQHFSYLDHESKLIRDGRRRNANPEMVKAIKHYSDADIAAVSDYLSRLPVLRAPSM
jgi:cytochrome c553